MLAIQTMLKYRGFEKEDGTILKVAYFDGYAFGDRLLEGVMFKATVTKGKLSVEPCPDAERYLKDLNRKKWLKEALQYAKDAFENGFEPLMNEQADGQGEDLCAIIESE